MCYNVKLVCIKPSAMPGIDLILIKLATICITFFWVAMIMMIMVMRANIQEWEKSRFTVVTQMSHTIINK